MEKNKYLTLPLSSVDAVNDPSVSTDGDGLVVSIHVDEDGQLRTMRLRFAKARAFRMRAEIHCAAWFIEGVFDNVCEISESDWVQELRSASPPEWRNHWVLRHFMLYLDSFGCVEVVAESVTLDNAL